MKSMLLTKAKLSLAALALATCLVATTALLVGPGLGAVAQETRDDKSPPASEGKPVTDHSLKANPRPWETVVRIRVLAESLVRFGSRDGDPELA